MNAKGFTLVEILIVVVILGILAAIVIPQFSGASEEANNAALMSNLQAIRSQIELYKIQHNDNLPTLTLTTALTTETEVDGSAGDSSGNELGPYMRVLPVNPYNDLATVLEAATTPGAADNTTGWFFNTANGEFLANDTEDANHFTY